jgi:hypothetical protein
MRRVGRVLVHARIVAKPAAASELPIPASTAAQLGPHETTARPSLAGRLFGIRELRRESVPRRATWRRSLRQSRHAGR